MKGSIELDTASASLSTTNNREQNEIDVEQKYSWRSGSPSVMDRSGQGSVKMLTFFSNNVEYGL